MRLYDTEGVLANALCTPAASGAHTLPGSQ